MTCFLSYVATCCAINCCLCARLCEAAEWTASSEGCFLKLAEGSSYAHVFERLRLNYIVTEYNSALIVENDHIIPRGVCMCVHFQLSQLVEINIRIQ